MPRVSDSLHKFCHLLTSGIKITRTREILNFTVSLANTTTKATRCRIVSYQPRRRSNQGSESKRSHLGSMK